MVAPGIRHSLKCKRRFEELKGRSGEGGRTALDAAVSEEERLERERSGAVAVEVETPITLPERATPASAPVAEDMEVELDESLTGEPIPESRASYEQRFKRLSDVSTEQLEREMNEEGENRMDALETGLYWSDSGQPVLSSLVWSLDGPVIGVPAILVLTCLMDPLLRFSSMVRMVIKIRLCNLEVRRCCYGNLTK